MIADSLTKITTNPLLDPLLRERKLENFVDEFIVPDPARTVDVHLLFSWFLVDQIQGSDVRARGCDHEENRG